MMAIRSNKVIRSEETKGERQLMSGIETLIVWTESNSTDMALSFQEAEGCAAIWSVLEKKLKRRSGLNTRSGRIVRGLRLTT